jgi:hypothetical protein
MSVIMLFSGCAYHSESLEYAEKHNLSKEIYSNVKIQCITDDKLSGKSVASTITQVIGTFMHKDCDDDLRSMIESHPLKGIMKYKACIGLANSTTVLSKIEEPNETIRINHIYTENIYDEKEYGYWGSETVGKKTIIFSHGDVPDIALDKYVKNSHLHCESIK